MTLATNHGMTTPRKSTVRRQGPTWRQGLLLCGILSSLLYAAMTVLVARQWPGYSSAAQTISELSAIDAPTRAAWVLPAAVYTLLVTAFGWGVIQSAGGNRRVRVAGAALLVYGALGLVWPFAPMHRREVVAAGGGTLSDTLHLVLASVTVGLMLVALIAGAVALGKAFRRFTLACLLLLALGAAMTFWEAPGLAAGLPTPWLGVWERINVGVFLVWIAVLACALWPHQRDTPTEPLTLRVSKNYDSPEWRRPSHRARGSVLTKSAR